MLIMCVEANLCHVLVSQSDSTMSYSRKLWVDPIRVKGTEYPRARDLRDRAQSRISKKFCITYTLKSETQGCSHSCKSNEMSACEILT